MSNIIYENHTIEEYNKKYPNRQSKLIKISKNNPSKEEEELLKKHNWWLIENTYYQIPKKFTWTWFRNLNGGIQFGSGILLVSAVTCAIVLPITLKKKVNPINPYQDDIDVVNKINETIKDQTYNTCYDFVNDVNNKAKIDITNLQTKNDKLEYVFDKEDNKVSLINKSDLSYVYPSKEGKKNNIWRFVSTIDENAQYSQYIKDDYDYLTNPLSLTVKAGIDVGNCDYFKSIKYCNENQTNNIIRTNGGSLIINASKDTIKHYGVANTVLINSVALESYHEFGSVATISIASGRLVVEKEASKIDTINIIKQTDESITTPVKIDVQENKIDEGKINKEEGSNIEEVKIGEKEITETIKKKDNLICIDDSDKKGQDKIIDAINNQSKIEEIFLKSDIDITIKGVDKLNASGIDITRGITIEGNGYSLNGKEEGEVTSGNAKHHNVLGIRGKNSDIKINNLKINYDDSLNKIGLYESIRIEDVYNSTITLNGVSNSKHNYYALYIYNNNEKTESLKNNGININVNDSELIGYSAVKCNANNLNFVGNNSTFTGINDKGIGSGNDCDTIQIGYPFWGTDLLNCDNKFVFNNCSLNAIYTPGETSTEFIFDSLSPLNNVLEFSNCEFYSSNNASHGEHEYHYISICEDDTADLIDDDIAAHCAAMGDESFKNIKNKTELFNKCPSQHYITIDNNKYGYNEEKGYIKDDRFKVGIINDNGDLEFSNY